MLVLPVVSFSWGVFRCVVRRSRRLHCVVRACVCECECDVIVYDMCVYASVACVDAGLATVTPSTVAVVFTVKNIVHNATVWCIIRKVWLCACVSLCYYVRLCVCVYDTHAACVCCVCMRAVLAGCGVFF